MELQQSITKLFLCTIAQTLWKFKFFLACPCVFRPSVHLYYCLQTKVPLLLFLKLNLLVLPSKDTKDLLATSHDTCQLILWCPFGIDFSQVLDKKNIDEVSIYTWESTDKPFVCCKTLHFPATQITLWTLQIFSNTTEETLHVWVNSAAPCFILQVYNLQRMCQQCLSHPGMLYFFLMDYLHFLGNIEQAAP